MTSGGQAHIKGLCDYVGTWQVFNVECVNNLKHVSRYVETRSD